MKKSLHNIHQICIIMKKSARRCEYMQKNVHIFASLGSILYNGGEFAIINESSEVIIER